LLNILDIVIVSIIAISSLIGVFRGLVRELMSLVGWIVSAWLAWRYAYVFAPVFDSVIESSDVRKAASFITIFLVSLVLFALLSYFISKIMSKSALKGMDRTLGMLFGLLRGVIIIAVVAILIQSTQFAKETWWTESMLKDYFLLIAAYGMSIMPAEVSRFFGQKV
jgi:membrane protein required for colicin V production